MSSLLEVGLSNALAALLIAPFAAWVGRGGRRPALAHGLWLLVLLKLVTPPLWTWSVPFAVPAWSSPQSSGERIDTLVEVPSHVYFVEYLDVVDEAVSLETEEKSPSITEPEPERRWWSNNLPCWAWVGGTCGWILLTTIRLRRFRLLLREARPALMEVQTMTDTLAHRLGLIRSPRVAMLPGSLSPFVWSLGGPPRLLLPASLWESLGDEQRATLLTHELAHLKRRDHWVRVLELVATALFWWHPVVYWARRGLREAEEQCCDAWVVWAWPKAAKVYASALLETVDFLAESRSAAPLPVAASGLGHVEQLKRRLTMIMSGLTPHRLSFAGRIVLTGLAAALLPLAPSLAQSAKEEVKTVTAKVVEGKPITVTVTSDKDDDDDDDDDDKKDKEKVKAKKHEEMIRDRVHAEVKAAHEAAAKAHAQAIEVRARAKADAAKQQMEANRKVVFFRTDAPAGPKKEASKEDKAALEKARAEMKELSEQMGKAAKRLAELEMKVNGVATPHVMTGTLNFKVDAKDGNIVTFDRVGEALPEHVRQALKSTGKPGENIEVRTEKLPDGKGELRVFSRVITSDIKGKDGADVLRFVVPPQPPAPPTPPAAPGDKEQNKRIEVLEKQLQELTRAIKELKRGEDRR